MAMPSLEEGFGLVFIEAMRRGVPVIASDVDAGREVNVDGVTGFTLSRDKPDEIAQAVISLLRDRDACVHRRRRRARRRLARLSPRRARW